MDALGGDQEGLNRMIEHRRSAPTPPAPAMAPQPELFFGLVGPAGTDLKTAVDALTVSLMARRYDVHTLRLSELLRDQDSELRRTWENFEEQRVRSAMDAGNKLCETLGANDAVARLGLAKAENIRRTLQQGAEGNTPLPRTAFIFNSLKRPEECDLLREVCGDAFFLISLYEPRHKRVSNLAKLIAKSHHAAVDPAHVGKAQKIICDDEQEEGKPFGQRVGLLFHRGDFFVEQDDHLSANIDRFIRLLFGAPFITPTRDEYGIFLAHAIAIRSADLSRQVGAVILSPEGDVIAEGCNEVPHQGGGAVWHDTALRSSYDNRDYKLGHDASSISKLEIFSDVIERLKQQGWLTQDVAAQEIEDLKDQAFGAYSSASGGYVEGFLKNSKLSQILEYGRVVHAEMHALASAARLGRSIRGSTLYCTTFPCHMCARHIIAAGIRRVVYIEPYPKSATGELYGPMVKIDGDPCALQDSVEFVAFNGLSPRQYLHKFSMKRRKDKRGYALREAHLDDVPRVKTLVIDFELASLKIKELHRALGSATSAEGEEND